MGVALSWFVAGALALRFKKRIGEVAAIGILIITVVISAVGGIVGLENGYYVALVFCFLCVLYVVIVSIRNRKCIVEYLLSPDSLAFAFVIAFFALNSIGRGITGKDESEFWGWALKGFYYFNDIFTLRSTHPKTALVWAYFAEKTWIGYSDGMALWAYDVLTASLFLPFFSVIGKKNRNSKAAVLVMISILLPLSLSSVAWSAILADTLFSVAVGYTTVAVYRYFTTGDRMNWYQILFGFYLISGTKRMGLLWDGILSLMVSYMLFKYVSDRRSIVLKCMVMPMIPVITYLFWLGIDYWVLIPVVLLFFGPMLFFFLNKGNKVRNVFFGLLMCVSVISGIYICNHVLFRDEITKRYTAEYWNAVFSGSMMGFGDVVHISLFAFWLLFVLYVLYIRKEKTDANHTRDTVFVTQGLMIAFAIVVFVSAMCLVVILYVMDYVLGIGGGSAVSSIKRYLQPCFMIVIFFCFYRFLESGEQIGDNAKRVIDKYPYATLLAFTVLMTDVSRLSEYILEKQEHVDFYGFEQAGITLTREDKIYYIQELKMEVDDSYRVGPAFQYDMFPAVSNVENDFWYKVLEDNNHSYISEDEFSRQLTDGKYDYVYIQNVDDEFMDRYGSMFEGVDTFISGSVFRVEERNGEVVLITLYNG